MTKTMEIADRNILKSYCKYALYIQKGREKHESDEMRNGRYKRNSNGASRGEKLQHLKSTLDGLEGNNRRRKNEYI